MDYIDSNLRLKDSVIFYLILFNVYLTIISWFAFCIDFSVLQTSQSEDELHI